MIRRNPVTAKEGEVLEAIARLDGLSTAPRVARELGISRLAAYSRLRSLRSKGLVRMSRNHGMMVFRVVGGGDAGS